MQTEVVLNNQRIWAPWRAEYILDESKNDSCVFCKVTNSTNNDDNKRLLVLKRGSFSFVIMNKYPYNPGHLMVVPYKHATYFDDLSSEIISEMIQLKIRSINALRNAMNPEGFNIGINIGQAAGAGVKDHLHIHIVPRWNGDTNFMPVLSSSRVISEALNVTYDKLFNEFRSIQ